MTRKTARALGAIACIAAHPGAVVAAPDGQQLSAFCASCHAADGRDTGIPPLARLGRDRIVQQMLAFRSGARDSQIMHVVADTLTPEEIAAIADSLAAPDAGSGR